MTRPSKVPKPLQPMLATLVDAPFDDPDWVFESKWDGFRLVASIENGSVTLYSRSGLIVSANYRPIAKALEKVKKDAVIDGELVALDELGVSRFQPLQNALNTAAHLHYCVFDIMFLVGKDLRGLPLVERKEKLRRVLPKDPLIISRIRSSYTASISPSTAGGSLRRPRHWASKASWPSAPRADISPARAARIGSRSRPPGARRR